MADHLKALVQRVDQIDQRLAVLAAQYPNAPGAKSGPGAGAALEPRLRVVLGTQPENCASAPTLAIGSGVAPRRIQRGHTGLIHRRIAKPQFDPQTWIEFAQPSTAQGSWAREWVEAKTKAGQSYDTAIRAWAYKWIRIL